MKFRVCYERVITYTGNVEIEAPNEDTADEIFHKMADNGEFDVNDEDLWDEDFNTTDIQEEYCGRL